MSTPKMKLIKTNEGQHNKHIRKIDSHREGTANYNFVPLNDTIFHYSADENPVDHSRFDNELFSGTLDCQLETLSEMYIGSNNDQFFQVNGELRIPGSSLRGLIRQMVGIMSYGKVAQIDDERTLFTRPMADEDVQFRKWYNDQLTEQERGEKRKSYTACAGYLFLHKGKFYIQPAEEHSNAQYKQVKIQDIRRDMNGQRLGEFSFKKRKDGSFYVASGSAPKKKREWLIYAPDFKKTAVAVPSTAIVNYQKDCDQANPSRRKKFNLLDTLKNSVKNNKDSFPQVGEENEIGIPVFYIERDGSVVTFGHTGLFRIAYEESIGKHTSMGHLDEDKMDLVERMFGRISKDGKDAHKTFVEVTDGKLVNGGQIQPEKKLILSGPKPTSFQNYLVQKHTKKDGKNHWGQGTWLRGHKMYWHHQFSPQDFSNVKSEGVYTRIKPIATGSKFKFTVSFNNLTEMEVGALITAIQLPEGCAHKIGMAKALGLGSVKIEAKFNEVKIKERYESLFDGDNWNCGITNAEMEDFASVFRGTIAKYASEYDKDKNSGLYWDLYRMRQLKKMLQIEIGQNLFKKGKLKDQGIDTRKRKVLPIPEDVR